MTGATSDIQWYIARDGKQHGPISDVEMRTFVDLGHLKSTDLLWRAGFPDWRPAPMVFPPRRAAAAPPPPPPQPIGPATNAQPDHPAQRQLEPAVAAHAPAARSAGPQAHGTPAFSGHGEANPFVPAGIDRTGAGKAAAPIRSPEPPKPIGEAPFFPLERHDPGEDDELEDAYAPQRSGRGFKVAAVLVALVLLATGAMLAYQMRDRLVAFAIGPSKPAEPVVVRAPDTPAKSPAVATSVAADAAPAPAQAAPVTASINDPALAALDARYQQTPLWTVAKREFPDWYGERLRGVAELEGKQAPPSAVAKYLVEQLVALRRKNADSALASSPARLKTIAAAFLDNLQQLSAHGAETCYGFISQGEVNPRIIELFQEPAQAAPIEAQAQAILEAIAEGRTAPNNHSRPQKSDYDMLAAQLGKLGWSQADMQLFSDPKALARAEPIRICKMVQDWFRAHIAIEDAAVQERLLYETLRPVVSG